MDNYRDSYFIGYLFNTPYIVEDGDKITITFDLLENKGVFTDDVYDENFYISGINFTIDLPFKIIDGNYEKLENGKAIWRYTWDNLPSSTWIKFDKSRTSDGIDIKTDKTSGNIVYILGTIFAIILLIGGYVYYQFKKHNDI